ncbi:MAG: uncharacterized protein JWP38_3736 [Herbaspirillum sp.]|nr:uncharacterized protein [Herbaspirillum sp.]
MPKLAYDMSPQDQKAALDFHRARWGIDFPGSQAFCRPEWKENINLAMDAQPALVTTPNSGIPAYLTYFTDPDILRVLTAPNEAAEIFGEKQKGEWTTSTLLFPVVERTYDVSSYGDYNNNGRAGINTNFPERQPYLYQTITEYGDLEIERVGLAKIGFVAEQKEAAIDGLNKFCNLTYFRGVAGLQNYGALNDPSLYAAIAPIPKANGGLAWLNGTAINGTANEIFADIQGLVIQLINQSSGQINTKSKFVLAMSPRSEGAMTATNTFNVNVAALLKVNFPNMEVKTAIQYGALTAQNPQGSAVGEIVQLWAPQAAGQDSGYCSFNTKLRAGPVVREMSAYKQKFTQGSAGFILRQPYAMATLVGV